MPMSREDHLFLRDLSLLLGIPLVLVVGILGWWQPWRGPELWAAPPETDIFAVVTGTWDQLDAENRCEDNPHAISFSPDRSVMIYEAREPWTGPSGIRHTRAEYEVIEYAPNRIRGRMTSGGESLVWDLELTDPDTYGWQLAHFPIGAHFATSVRCEVPDTGMGMAVCPAPDLIARRLEPVSPLALIGSDTLYPPEMVESPPQMQGTVTIESGRLASPEDTGAVVVRYAVSPAGRVPPCYIQVLESPTDGLGEDVRWMLTHARFWPARRAGGTQCVDTGAGYGAVCQRSCHCTYVIHLVAGPLNNERRRPGIPVKLVLRQLQRHRQRAVHFHDLFGNQRAHVVRQFALRYAHELVAHDPARMHQSF